MFRKRIREGRQSMKIAKQGCPVCGFPDHEALDDSGANTFKTCPCCGAVSGCDYGVEVKDDRLLALRRAWFIDHKGKWWSAKQLPPKGWNPQAQLKTASLKMPL